MSVIKKRVAGIPRISVLILSLFCGLLTGLLVSCDYFDLSLERFIQEQDEIGRNPGEDLPDPPDPPDPEPTVYNITINAGSPANGTVTASIAGTEVTTAPEGAVLTVTITPDSGYSLTSASYTYTIGSSPSTHPLAAGTQTITMPAADITVDVVFTAAGSAVAMRGSTTYASLKAAIDDAPAGSAGSIDEISLLHNITLPEGSETTGYTIAKYIRLVSSPGGTTITRKTGFTGSLFVVSSYNVSLTLGSAASGPLIIDGNMANVTAQAPLINVSGGILNIDAGAFLQNNRNTGTSLPGGAIAINVGTISINGGTIRDNISQSFGGGINAWGGDISMSGGTITGN
ncbi:MAG: hypothetical protein LBN21_10150, partial [Treponema sp.]|nr:hypothetical protein [Treponema sp.]